MDTLTNSIGNSSRRQVLQGALGLAAAAAVAAPAMGKAVHVHKMRLRLEGDVNLAWVHSLFMPPVVLPPGTVARLRIESPAFPGPPNGARDRATTLFYVFVAPAGVPPGEPAPELAPVSRGYVVTENVVLSVAEFGDPATRPAKNVVMVGKYISNDVVSPFGLLTGRAAFTAFGFDWIADGSDEATFKLVTVGAAGSHVTVVPEAAGELAFE
jgi:hypothetical protein